MKKYILKNMSLCLAMALLLSVFAMPAFAEERAVHIHSYDIPVGEKESLYYPYDNEKHRVVEKTTFACSCKETSTSASVSYKSHTPAGSGTIEYTFTNAITGDTVYYVRYTCSKCHDSFTREEY